MTVKGFFGMLLCIVGGGIGLVTGGCALLMSGGLFIELWQTGRTGFIEPWVPLIIGGIPSVVGIVLFFVGRWLWRRRAPQTLKMVSAPPESQSRSEEESASH